MENEFNNLEQGVLNTCKKYVSNKGNAYFTMYYAPKSKEMLIECYEGNKEISKSGKKLGLVEISNQVLANVEGVWDKDFKKYILEQIALIK